MLAQNQYQTVLEHEKTKEELKRFSERFRVRLFYEKYRGLARLCNTCSWVFNGLSVASGVLGVASLLAMFIYPNLWIMAIPAFLILGLSEFAKRVLLTNWLIEKLRDKNKGINKALLTANILLIVVSMFATVYGGIELVNIARGKAKPQLINTQSIEVKYKADIAKIEALQAAITKRNTYNGNTYLPKDERALNAKYDADIRTLRKDQKQAINKAQQSNDQKLATYHQGTNQYIIGFVFLSLLIEGLCILTIVFPIYYQYKSLDDKEKLTRAFKTANLSTDTLYNLMHKAGLPVSNLIQQFSQHFNNSITNQAQLATVGNEPIIQRYDQEQNVPTNKPVSRKRGKVVNYDKVYALIDKGGLTIAEIANKCKCSESTVRTAKRERKRGNRLTND